MEKHIKIPHNRQQKVLFEKFCYKITQGKEDKKRIIFIFTYIHRKLKI